MANKKDKAKMTPKELSETLARCEGILTGKRDGLIILSTEESNGQIVSIKSKGMSPFQVARVVHELAESNVMIRPALKYIEELEQASK